MQAVDVLMNEHRIIRRALDVLEAMANHVTQNHEVPVDRISALLEFFHVFADRCHHAKEEGALFPQLDENGLPCMGGPIGVMLCEHVRGRAIRRRMQVALEAWDTPQARQQFVRAAREFIELLRSHIEREDHVLFRMASEILTADQDREIARAYDRHEQEIMGAGVHERFHRLIDELAAAFLQ